MSCQAECAGTQVDSADGEEVEAQGCADPAHGSIEPGPSLTSVSLANADPKVKYPKPQTFTFHDCDQKVLVLNKRTLIAVHKKPNIHPETFYVLAARTSSADDKENLVFLAVSKGELCLCCEMDKKKGQPVLQLKEQKLSWLSNSVTKDVKGFTFYRRDRGSRHALESADHKGWFISTRHENEAVRMTDKLGGEEFTDFKFMEVSNTPTSPREVSE
ncbi:unnamed protein product [Pipistrellus nathusii]|uniref:Interleukin-1 n=1 Tax=Pipistrellus nathusii TaxID=59473 RepID=A0ABN9ZAF5_PIPNA